MTKLKIPASGVDTIIEETMNLIKISDKVKNVKPNISVLEALKKFCMPKLRTSFLTKQSYYIPPEKIILGLSYKNISGKLQSVSDKGYIIPMLKSLELFLNKPEAWSDVINGHGTDNELMKDFCDGQFVKSNQFIQQHKPCLQFLINTDSLEVVNPIGAHVKKHKINVFYWTLANIRPSLRAHWSSMHLLGICKTNYLKKHGIKVFLSDFVKTLKDLHNGIQFNINEQNTLVFGTLLAVLADTPGAAFIADLKQSFFAKKFCWNCNINTDEIQTKITVAELEERCPVLHLQRCNDLENMPERLRPFWSKNWVINGTSLLLEIQNFNICVNMPQDVLHVLLEGLFGYATCLLLQLCIEDKLFDVNWLNSQLQSFPYSYLDRDNKPEKITQSQIFENVALK